MNAFEFNAKGIRGSVDTTTSIGFLWRTQARSPALYDINNGGTGQNMINSDDGDLNYNTGLISAVAKATHDIELDYRNYGAFFRASYYYDPILAHKSNLSDIAKKRLARNFRFLDAYAFGHFKLSHREISVRAGNQVVNWGESTFIGNGINVVNPVDVSKIRIPGSEIKEALIPTPMVWVSTDLTDNLSIETMYLFGFTHVRLEPRGAYFSTNDVLSPGSDHLIAGFGVANEAGNIPGQTTFPNNVAIPDGFFIIPRASDHLASDLGQGGLVLRWYAEPLNNTEFGLYLLNYHSRLPLVSFVAGTNPNSARYFVEYPENIHLLGLGFNTLVNTGGIALQGEFSYRDNLPLQIEFAEVAMAATQTKETTDGGFASQLGQFNPGEVVQGYKRLRVGQYQLTATKSFGRSNPFFASTWAMVAEVGATQVYNMPNVNTLRFEAPGTNLPARSDINVAGHSISANKYSYATDFSWGYRVLSRATYNNAIGAVSLSPRVIFTHDVSGTSPGPGGNFIEGRMSGTLAVSLAYQETSSMDLSYTRYFGAAGRNYLADRDFVSLNAKYGF